MLLAIMYVRLKMASDWRCWSYKEVYLFSIETCPYTAAEGGKEGLRKGVRLSLPNASPGHWLI